MNFRVMRELVSGVSMRECARKLHIHRTTVARKKRFMAQTARDWMRGFLETKTVQYLQFDDMETFEHSKMKPLSITIAVEKRTRLIIGFAVSCMPAKGPLSKKALQKYGRRPDLRAAGRAKLFKMIKSSIEPEALIESDENPHYKSDVRKHFPRAVHKAHPGRRGCVTGQGELKAGGFDPLFSLNHTCAMLRANINRLFRRTWCTTKKAHALEDHIYLYAKWHNTRLLSKI
ncbi:MAG: hypothetical protein AB7F86_19080 [Bdellovibrionales bacterium]